MKNMKKWALAAALTIAATPSMAASALQDILSEGVLKVGTTGD